MARKEFSTQVKKDALVRASKLTGFPCCESCGVMLKKGRYAFDHVNPDGLTGQPTLENCEVVCSQFEGSCHDKKTRVDTGMIADAKRWEARDMGIRPKSKFQTGRDGPYKQKIGGQVVRRNP
jgi:hypothetical protein